MSNIAKLNIKENSKGRQRNKTNGGHPQTNSSIIFTIGHSTHPLDAFIDSLRAYNIARVIDIRSMPRSRHNPQFNSDTLGRYLRNHKINYRHLAKLGGLRSPRKDSVNTGWHNRSFQGFADYMQTSSFENGLTTLIKLAEQKPTVIMCAESVPWRCHRSLVADALAIRGFKVINITGRNSAKEHRLNPLAYRKRNILTYPP